MLISYSIQPFIFIFSLFLFYNLTLCSENEEPFLYKRSPDYLINNHYFEIPPAKDSFSLNEVQVINYPDDYTLKQLHLLSRHGSRYPNLDQITHFDKIDKAFANVSVAKEWPKNPFPTEKQNHLTTRGKLESYYNGLQCRKRYEKFWKNVEYDADVVKFQTGDSFWVSQSAMAFTEGLLDGTGPVGACKNEPAYIWSLPAKQDTILTIYLACKRWNMTVSNNFTYFTEQTYSYGNETLAPLAEKLTKKYDINPPLDPLLIPYMYYYCDFWVGVFKRSDTWCELLSDDELILARYPWNMKNYFVYSYGHPFNELMGCAYITQFVNSVENYLSGNSRMIADLKYTQGFPMSLILTTLGVYKNKYPITANLTLEQMKSLKYIETKVLHWTSTIYFEIYTSPGRDALLRLVVDYEPYIIPGCDGEYCKWTKFKNIFGDKINCDFEKMCAYP